MGKIRWSMTAHQNLEDIANYIAQDAPFYAIHFVERILEEIEKLADFPRLGRVVPEFRQEHIRELIFHNYRFVYSIKEDIVFIISISHGSVDMKRKSQKEQWELN